ncbi:Rif1_N domain-containing protein [Cephalotus follicularis]|uniref:Rif1_N domain-containing protein n=1 Tax=Cephalotus follicularis TaxID=3775 RepID=A0A1Q3D7F4_CEPFO|nr:Rif1_N domain-containing protein [Cephalotus follicularis]
MSKISDQLEQVKNIMFSTSKANKSFAYSTLLHFQEQSSDDTSSIQTLVDNTPNLVPVIVSDIFDDDEEIAAQALKCLGFMIYHPSLVDTISVNYVNLILESLVKLITTTKIKSICNLGVWCISIQQFKELAICFSSIVRAVVHALDNPSGSLSTTFEAIQAVIKLASQSSEKMRELSHMWAPSIYRRLLSVDKRERDMSERCLVKISSTIFPSTVALSKTLLEDMKQKLLLTGMKDMLKRGMKVQAIQAWGWFIHLLGSHAMKNRHLINDMLKIPEQTFSDINPQVQIASQVAWERLIDALIQPQLPACKTNAAMEIGLQFVCLPTDGQANGLSKSIKLIMTPLIGIMLSKCDASVHSSCLNTWRYLLHKLDTYINCPPVIKLVLGPMFEAVFQIGPDRKSVWPWNMCLDLLNDFILAKCRNVDYDSNDLSSCHLSTKISVIGPSICGSPLKEYPIKWLPWDLNQLGFYTKMIKMIISPALKATITSNNVSLAYDAALRIFRSVLRGVQMELKVSTINYNDIMLCLNTILKFIKWICEDLNLEDSGNKGMHYTSLRFVEAVIEDLEPSVLGSPVYKVALDLNYIDYLQSLNDNGYGKFLGISLIAYMDRVSPMVYLIIIYISVVIQSTANFAEEDTILQGMYKLLKFILSSYEPLENLLAAICFLYNHVGFSYLPIWIAMANSLKGGIDVVKDLSGLKMESNNSGCLAICHLLAYPFVVCFSPQKKINPEKFSGSLEEFVVSLKEKIKLENVSEVWISLYGSVSTSKFESSSKSSFAEDLCLMLNNWIDKTTSIIDSGTDLEYKDLDLDLLSLFGDFVICVLELTLTSEVSPELTKTKCYSDSNISSCANRLGFVARFMKLSWTKIGTKPPSNLTVTSRVFSALARFVSCSHLKQIIVSFVQIISSPLVHWLSHVEMKDKRASDQLQILWSETLKCLQRSEPPINYDSSFLKLHACVLEKTLDHPDASISEPTISFWNSTYGKQIKLDYPQNLLHVLNKLYRNGKINLHARRLPVLKRCNSRMPVDIAAPQGYRVTATHSRSSKRVELIEDTMNHFDQMDKLSSSFKRKRLELTEHQKEVRRAQQGRERDCSGHGPGIRTYTSIDFSQGNEDSQESQDVRDPESILEMLKGAA